MSEPLKPQFKPFGTVEMQRQKCLQTTNRTSQADVLRTFDAMGKRSKAQPESGAAAKVESLVAYASHGILGLCGLLLALAAAALWRKAGVTIVIVGSWWQWRLRGAASGGGGALGDLQAGHPRQVPDASAR